jgi:sporulation protein YlmC with PRC-barrel domain
MKVVDADGKRIGTIQDVFLDRHTGEPEWATVKTGRFARKSSFVPIRDAEAIGDNDVRVPFRKEQVESAPTIDPDGELSPDEERLLYEHYGRSDYDEWTGQDRTEGPDLPLRAPAIAGVRLRRVVVVVPDRGLDPEI